jgi:nitroreductase
MTSNTLPPTQLLSALQWRYATKVFDPARRIPDDTWAALQQSLVLAPSSFGLQPYRFLVVKDPAVRQSLVPHAWGQKQVVDASHFVVFAARTSVTEAEIDQFLRLVAESRTVAPESLASYRGMMTGMLLNPDFKSLVPHWTARQAYIALGGLMTSAALLGVDACPIEGFVPAEFDRILGLPARGLAAAVCCALGYRHPSDKYATLPKVRFPADTLIQSI